MKAQPLSSKTIFSIWREEFWQSIKAFDTEDKGDLYFFRPLGFLIAKISAALHLSPTFLTLTGMCCGLFSGMLFYAGREGGNLELAGALFLFAGILDSADGQLARLTGNFSRIGLVLDGVCDNIVFASVYIGCTIPLQFQYGPGVWFVAVGAGICHSLQSATLDFYNREYLYFGCGNQSETYWNPSVEEADRERAMCRSRSERIAWWLRRSWIGQQQWVTSRPVELRMAWKTSLHGEHSLEFQKLYRECNKSVLRFWRPLGANVHTTMILLFMTMGRFELYLLLVDIGLLTMWLVLMRSVQHRADLELISRWRR